MIASGAITTHLSWAFEECSILAWLEGETLGEILSSRREDLKGTPRFLSQGQMTKRIRQAHGEKALSQGRISYFENDLADIMTLQPEVRLSLLNLYHFTDDELNTLNERFSLRLPLAHETQYLNNLVPSPQNSAIVWFKDIRNAGADEGIPVRRDLLEGISEDRFDNLMIADNVLMPSSLSKQLRSGTVLFCTPDAKAEEDDWLAFKYVDQDRYVVLEREQLRVTTPVFSLDGLAVDLIQPNDKRIKLLGISVAETATRRSRAAAKVRVS